MSLWADQIDEAWTDNFSVQDRIAERVVEALTLRLTPAERSRLTRRETQSGAAYRLYTLGRYHFLKLVPVEIEKGIAYYRQAIGVDPRNAAAYADLAEAYRALAVTSDRPAADVLPVGKEAALKAIALDPGLASAEASLCFIQLSDPGRRAEAIGHARRAAGLEPLSLITRAIEGHVLLHGGQAAEAEAGLRPTLGLDSRRALAVPDELRSRAPARHVPPLSVAMIQSGPGERDQAFERLDKAYADHDVRLTFLEVDRRWHPLRADPRFGALLRRLGPE